MSYLNPQPPPRSGSAPSTWVGVIAMTHREFFAVAVMLSTNFDERSMALAEREAETAHSEEWRDHWWSLRDEDAQRIGAKRALWLEAQP